MSEKVDKVVRNKMAAEGEAICLTSPSGDISDTSEKMSKLNTGVSDIERYSASSSHDEKKKKRRQKRRGAPYIRVAGLTGSSYRNLPNAPYNTNDFLIDDHSDMKDFDVKFVPKSRKPRKRDDSFTSNESDQEFYSSPEDEEEFLTQEFKNAYEDVHVESLASMSKMDLIQTVLKLEEKVGVFTYPPIKVGCSSSIEEVISHYIPTTTTTDNNNDLDTIQKEGSKDTKIKKEMPSATTSEDSESDSSTSCSSTEDSENITEIEMQIHPINEDIYTETDITMESENVT